MNEPTTQDQKAILTEQLRLLGNTIWTKTSLAKAFAEAGLEQHAKPMAEEAAGLQRVHDVITKQLYEII